jgi:hypothetical protein
VRREGTLPSRPADSERAICTGCGDGYRVTDTAPAWPGLCAYCAEFILESEVHQ